MKKILFRIIAIIGVITILLFMANSFIRVSDGSGHSWGIVEEKVFGGSIVSFLEPPWSENYKRWELANLTSSETAVLIQKYGQDIFANPALEEKKIEAADKLREAHLAAREIDPEYLRASNTALPDMYSEHFVQALSLWHEGFLSEDPEKVIEGIDCYNRFILWMQSQERSDFKPLR